MQLSVPALPRFNRDVNLLLIVTGVLAISFFGIQTFLKILYILRLGYGPEYLGLFNAAGALGYMAMSLPAGALGSRFGMKRTMLAGTLITAFGMAILPFVEVAPAWAQFGLPILSQTILAGGYALFSINLVPALMAVTSNKNRNSAYAFSSTLRGLGTFVGTVSGGLLPGFFGIIMGEGVDQPGPYRLGLWVAAALALVALFPLAQMRESEQTDVQIQNAPSVAFPVLPVGLLVVYVVFSQAANATCQSFCNAFMDTELGLSPSIIGLITGTGQFVAIFVPMLGPRLATRYGHGWTLMVVSLLSGLSLIPIILFPHWLGAGMGRFGTLALSAMWMPALQVYQMEMVDSRWRSLAYGAVSMAMGMSFGVVSFSGGYVVAGWGYSSLFAMGLGLSVLGASIMWVMRRQPAMTPALASNSSGGS